AARTLLEIALARVPSRRPAAFVIPLSISAPGRLRVRVRGLRNTPLIAARLEDRNAGTIGALRSAPRGGHHGGKETRDEERDGVAKRTGPCRRSRHHPGGAAGHQHR